MVGYIMAIEKLMLEKEEIIHVLVKTQCSTLEIELYPLNTMWQVLCEYGKSLDIDDRERFQNVWFKNGRTKKETKELNSTAEELELESGDTLLICKINHNDATMNSHFAIAYNTAYRMHVAPPKRKKDYHELIIGFSNTTHFITFYTDNSTLNDIMAPFLWRDDFWGNINCFTDGKSAILMVNEENGKCAKPSEFDTLISDFVGSETELGRLFVILEDKDVSGMHLDSFSFGE